MPPKTISKISVALGALTALIGALGVIGWLTGTPVLFTFPPGQPPMVFNTALALVVFGLGVLGLKTSRLQSTRWLGIVLLLLGGVTMLQFALNSRYGIDPQWLVRRLSLPPRVTGRMSMFTASAFVLLGSALVLAARRRQQIGAVILLSAFTCAFAAMSLGGRLLQLEIDPEWGLLIGMASPAAAGIFLGSGAMLLVTRQSVPERERASADALGFFALAAVAVMSVGLAAWNSNKLQGDAGDLASHSHEVIDSMNYLELCVTRMESAARGYALGQQETYLTYYNDIEKRLVTEMNWLRWLADDNPAQKARTEELIRLANLKRTFMRDVIVQIKAGQIPLRPESFQQRQGPDLMAAIRAKGNEMENAERALLTKREADTDRTGDLTGRVITNGEIIAALLVLLALHFVRNADLSRLVAQDELRVANESLEQRVRARTAELQKAIDQLVDRERSRRFLADAIPQLVWTATAEGAGESFNRSWCEYTGLTEAESKADGWGRVVHSDDLADTIRHWQDILHHSSEGGGEYRLRRARDGAYRWMLWRARPEHDLDGKLIRWVGTSTDIHDQKEARAELESLVEVRTAELARVTRLQRAVLDGATFSVVASDRTGLITEFNRGAEKMLGYTREEMIGRPTPAFWHLAAEIEARAAALSRELGREITPSAEVFTAIAKTGRVDEHEWTYVRKDGGHVPVLLSVTALRDESGRITGFLGTAVDLTERKAAEAALRESETRFRSSFDSAGIGMALVGLDGRWLQVNQTTCEIVGYPEKELLRKTFQDITHPDDLGADLANVQALLAGESRSYQMEKRYFHRDGHIVWINLTASLVRGLDGAPVHFVSQIEDITGRKKLEQALRDSEARLSNVFRSMAEGLVLHDAAGLITECNAAAERILGISRAQMMGATAVDPRWCAIREDGTEFTPDERPSGVTRLTGKSQRDVVMGVRKPDGSLTWVTVNSEAIFGPDEKVHAVVVSFADVSERKQLLDSLAVARDQALEASRLKSEFLASMSHEIRTPMNGIIGMSGLLMETGLTHEQQEMGLVIQNSAESLLTIINDILDFSKIEAGKLRIELGDFELKPLVEETLALLAPRAHEKNIELLCDIDPRLNLTLRGDAGRVRQVLLNLTGNAIKFTERGEVVVAAKCQRETSGRTVLRVEVIDTGIGIPVAAQRQLFQPFVQADGSTTRRFGGTGLGLAISRQLVELMGGEIGFHTEESAGSTFWFELDLQKRPSAPSVPLPPFAPGRRVLVVDDNANNRRILTGQLKSFGVESEAAADAPTALEAMRTAAARGTPYELVLLDWHMPDIDGLGLAVEIRADPALAEIPLIMLSSSTMQADTPTVEAVRFAALLTKPVREAQLHRTLLRVLGGEPHATVAGKSPATTGAPFVRSGLRLLVAEDNPTNQLVVRRFLERMGHTIDITNNGEETLAQLARKTYDAVLMDCQMPVMDGYTATKRIRSGELPGVNARIPVIALTAYAMPSDRLKCLAAGMDEYVAKPLRVAELGEALRRCGLHSEKTGLGEPPPSAPAVTFAAGDFLDPRQVEQLRSLPGQDGGSLLHDLIKLFLEEMPGTLSRLGDQLERRAGDELVMTAHKLAGACANLGATDLQAAAVAVENAGRAGKWSELPARLAQADREWMRLQHHLENFPTETDA